jgi:hypothetical protein
MIRELAFASKQGMTAETLLWRGVIAVTIQDWLSKPLRPKREAERYLFENSADLSLVCSSAGIDVGQLRERLNKVRGRTLLDLCQLLNNHGPNTERKVRPDVGRATGQ